MNRKSVRKYKGFLNQEYYKRHKAKIQLEDGNADAFTFDNYSQTEHISRKRGAMGEITE